MGGIGGIQSLLGLKFESRGPGFESRSGWFLFVSILFFRFVKDFQYKWIFHGGAEKFDFNSRKINFDSPVVMHEMSPRFWGYGFSLPLVFRR